MRRKASEWNMTDMPMRLETHSSFASITSSVFFGLPASRRRLSNPRHQKDKHKLPQCEDPSIESGYNSAFPDHDGLDHDGHYRSSSPQLNGRPLDVDRWSMMRMEENEHLHKVARFQASPSGWPVVMGIQSAPAVKKFIRLHVPVDKYPNYNFVGRILGPRGNSLKRVEALTQCRVYIRGKGSVKDSIQEERLKDKPGYEHLNEPLHILVQAEFPGDMINTQMEKVVVILENLLKPVDKSLDHYKKQQLWEMAMLNGMKRAKTGR